MIDRWMFLQLDRRDDIYSMNSVKIEGNEFTDGLQWKDSLMISTQWSRHEAEP